MANIKHIHCPANGWDCPYYTDEGHPCRCTLEDPLKDCDDFGTFWEEGDDFIDDDWEEHDWDERHTPSMFELNP